MSLKSLLKSLLGSETKQPDAPRPAPQIKAEPQPAAPVRDCTGPGQLEAILARALDQIPGVTYRQEVPAAHIDPSAHPAAKPVTFLVYREDRPVLALMAVRDNTYRSMPVVGTQRLLEGQGIPFLRFFRELENADDYVLERIRSAV